MSTRVPWGGGGAEGAAALLKEQQIFLLSPPQVLTKKKLQDLVREVDPNEQLDEDVEEVGTKP